MEKNKYKERKKDKHTNLWTHKNKNKIKTIGVKRKRNKKIK